LGGFTKYAGKRGPEWAALEEHKTGRRGPSGHYCQGEGAGFFHTLVGRRECYE